MRAVLRGRHKTRSNGLLPLQVRRLLSYFLPFYLHLTKLRCRLASPSCLLPLVVPSLIVGGDRDYVVPLDLVQDFHSKCVQSLRGAAGYTAPRFLFVEGADHFQLVDAACPAWEAVYEAMTGLLDEVSRG